MAVGESDVELVHEGSGGGVFYGPEGGDRRTRSSLLYLITQSENLFTLTFCAGSGLASAQNHKFHIRQFPFSQLFEVYGLATAEEDEGFFGLADDELGVGG